MCDDREATNINRVNQSFRCLVTSLSQADAVWTILLAMPAMDQVTIRDKTFKLPSLFQGEQKQALAPEPIGLSCHSPTG